MSVYDIPPEIWNIIFALLPHQAILSLNSVARMFHHLSLPVLFYRFTFRPALGGLRVGSRQFQRELQRLEFWSSEHIAPHVLTATIYLLGIITSSSPLTNAVFKAISRFSNLRNLAFRFSQRIDVSALPLDHPAPLATLRIDGGSLFQQAEALPLVLSVRHFVWTNISAPVRGNGISQSSFLSILHPDTLDSLELDFRRPDSIDHFSDTTAMHSFHKLRSLLVIVDLLQSDYGPILSAIASFPAIEDLIFDMRGIASAETPPSPDIISRVIAPHLHRYKGPANLLSMVLPGTQPINLSITFGNPASILQALLRLGQSADLSRITSLSLSVLLYTELCQGAVLLDLLARFPHLTRLAIRILSDAAEFHTHTSSDTLDGLVNILTVPPMLRDAVLRFRLVRKADENLVPRVETLIGRVRQVNPRLNVIFSNLSGDFWGF
ncbi:hypothetical protein R3P38DRAFT_2866032 [Favolaschia claudopus]|uniref:F-box domain-containing protein n=1 Tax=Favolaschia claudopus TaxID=2862362 RepID=A0AAW0DIN8_9AGAR